MKNILNICSVKQAQLCVSILAVCIFLNPVTAHAEKYQLIPDLPECIPIYDGGLNMFDGKRIDYNSTNELEAFEQTVIATGDYVLASTDDKELTDEAFDKLLSSCRIEDGERMFWWENFLNPENTFHDTYSKVYLYKPVLEEYMKALEDNRLQDNPYLLIEMECSTVVIDYGTLYFHERIGADMSEEINDNIPEWFDTGYLQIETPVNIEITLFLTEEQNYYTFYVQKDTPFVVKLKQGGYNVVSVNNTETGDGEETLPFNDLIQITADNLTKTNPYQLQMQNFTEKYNIQDINLTNMPDRSEDKSQNLPVEKTTVEWNEELDKQEQAEVPFFFYLICIILLIILAFLTVIYLKKRYSNGKKGDYNEKKL